MSEQKKKTVSDLQQEYTQLCSKAGHLSYQIYTLKAELNAVQDTLRSINLEAAALAAASPAPEGKSNE